MNAFELETAVIEAMLGRRFLNTIEAQTVLEMIVRICNAAGDIGWFFEHAGFDLDAIEHSDDLFPAWFRHYRVKAGLYNTERALQDFCSWPPITAMINDEVDELRAAYVH